MSVHSELLATEVTNDDLIREIRELRESHDRILAAVTEIMAQVSPTLDALKDSPILKMLGVR